MRRRAERCQVRTMQLATMLFEVQKEPFDVVMLNPATCF